MLEKEVSKLIGLSWKSKDQLQEDWCHKFLITKIVKTIKIINIIESYRQCQILFTHLVWLLRIFGWRKQINRFNYNLWHNVHWQKMKNMQNFKWDIGG
jgi:hypothetical protein